MKTVQTLLKSLIKILLLLFLSASILLCSAQENVKSLTFYSKSLKKGRKVEVYLPEDYNENESVRYPVIYFLHGTAQNSFSEGNLLYIAKKLISSKIISPVIIVKPDGSCGSWGDSYFMNSAVNGNFEDYLVKDLIAFIDSAFRTNKSRNKRSIMGYSAGGSDAMRTALKHPEIFCCVVSHSGRLNMSSHSLYIPGVLSENGGAPVSSFNPKAGPMSQAVFTMAAAFSPNMNNPPYFVDFPFDGNGNFIDSIWNRWLLNDCSFLAKKISKKDDLTIYFDCGTFDEEATYPFNTSFADSLSKIGLPCQFQSYSGGHYDRDSRYPIGLAFLDSVMNKTIKMK
ncbi:MAG: prolyl oligopeptidase family serine peptidase [Prolixibacteraceae bacterium]|nr:prolyl oligopeptidase family serine peptidase [Prolixibacteraceae bacterium]